MWPWQRAEHKYTHSSKAKILSVLNIGCGQCRTGFGKISIIHHEVFDKRDTLSDMVVEIMAIMEMCSNIFTLDRTIRIGNKSRFQTAAQITSQKLFYRNKGQPNRVENFAWD